MAEAHRLIVGARGWEHTGWHDAFYPEDLPEDWRLSYYANEFTGVLVPEPVWRMADSEEIAIWCDDVADGFLFFLEESEPDLLARSALSYRELFGSHWGGIPAAGEAMMAADEIWDLRRLRERFDSLIAHPQGEAPPGFFICGDPPDIQHLREARLLADIML